MPLYVPNPTPGAPTPAEIFEQLGAEITARYAAAEEIMIARVAELARRAIDVPPGLLERAEVLRELRQEGERIARAVNDPELVARIMAIAAADGEASAIAQLGINGYTISGRSGITGTAAQAVGAMSLDLTSRLENMSARITRWMPDTYQRVISLVAPNVILGVETLAEAQRRAAQALIARGVTGFVDEAGNSWRIGTYAEMATRTAVNRAWQDANIQAMQAEGINLVTIVIGVNACSRCAAHAGKIYSTDGTPAGTYTVASAIDGTPQTITVAGTLDQARAQGWNHPNCRCVVVGYFAGVSIPEGTTTYSRQAEENRDRLRSLERRVRDLKRKQLAAFDDVTTARYGARIRDAQKDIREFIAETGMIRRRYREQLSFSDGTLPSLPPAPRPRLVAPPTPRALTALP